MTERWLRTPAATRLRRALPGGTVVTVLAAVLHWGRADVQVDGPVVRQATAWLRGASGGSDSDVGGLLFDGRAVDSGTTELYGGSGVTEDFAARRAAGTTSAGRPRPATTTPARSSCSTPRSSR